MVNIFFIFPMFLIYFNDGVDSLNRPKFSLFFNGKSTDFDL